MPYLLPTPNPRWHDRLGLLLVAFGAHGAVASPATPPEPAKPLDSGLPARPSAPATDPVPPTLNRAASAGAARLASWGVAPGWDDTAPLTLIRYGGHHRPPWVSASPRWVNAHDFE